MGQCLGTSNRTPSALKLCQAYERQCHDELERAPGGGSPNQVLAEANGSIWQHMAPDEVRAVGDIVSTWAQRLIDGQSARRQLQMRVLRGHTPASLSVLHPRNNASGQNNAGPSPRSRGSNPTSAATRRNGAPSEDEPPPVVPPTTSSSGPGFRVAVPQQNASGQQHEAHAPVVAMRNPGEAAVFGGMGFGLFAGLAAAIGGSAWNGSQVHEIFSTIDSLFSVNAFEDARVLAMRELGLEGSRALPEEVRAIFHRRVKEILQAAPNPQRVTIPWLDLVRLCLFVEVVRHIRASSSTTSASSSSGAMNGPISTEILPMSMPMTAVPLALARGGSRGPGGGPRTLDGPLVTPLGTTGMNVIFVTGLPDGRAGGGMTGFGISRINGNMDVPFRVSPDFLRERVGLLLEVVLGGVDGQDARPVGLTTEEMDQHCPIGTRETADGGCCPICLEPEVAGEPVRKFPCSHAFHPSCCEAWLSNADTCPACRFQIQRGGE